MQAMIQAASPASSAPLGQLVFILLLAVMFALPVSFGLIWLYRRAVFRSMRARASSLATEPVSPAASTSPHQPIRAFPAFTVVDSASSDVIGPAAGNLYADIFHAPRRAAAIYVVAGAAYALTMAVILIASNGEELLPLRTLLLFWVFAWPIVLTVNLVAAATRRARLATATVYFLTLAVLEAIIIAGSSESNWIMIIMLWFLVNLPSTILLLTFLNRRVRAVGPLVLIFMLVAASGLELILFIAESDEGLLRSISGAGSTIGLGATTIFFGLAILGCVIISPVGWLTLRWIRSRYERKKISDQSITLDAIWLLFGVANSLVFASNGMVWILSGLLAFLIYKVVVWAGFSLFVRKSGSTRRIPKLLLLRVFSLGKRSERLFNALTTHWRHVGSIQLIAGTDLATDNIEPHEFLDFLSRKLARRFIDGAKTLALRLSEMDTEPDQDGRFRVNEFFCFDDTWRMVLSRLVSESDVVLMDIRGFSPQNAGCIFEISELINVVPLGRIEFIIDDTTDEQFLLRTMRQAWERMRPTSPNRLSTSGQFQLFRFTGSRSGELRQLLGALCVAANPA